MNKTAEPFGKVRRSTSHLDRSGETWNLIYRLAQHWPLAILCGVLAATAGYLYARLYEPIYHSEAQVRVGDFLDARSVPGQKEDSSEMVDLPENLANGFRTRFLVEPKLKALADELAEVPSLAHLSWLKSDKGRDELIEHIKLHAQVEAVTRRVFRVSYDGHDPLLVQRVVQRLAEIGVDDVIDQRSVTAQQARAFLSGETESTRQHMLAAEADVVRFLREHPRLLVPSGGSGERNKLGLSIADKLLLSIKGGPAVLPLSAMESAMSPEVRGLLGQRAELEARISQIESAQKFDPVQNKISEIDRLQQQLSELKAQNYTKDYPEYQRVVTEIDRLQQEIRDHKSRRDRNLAQDLRTLSETRAQMATLDRQIAQAKRKASPVRDRPQAADERALSAEAEYARLVRDMESARTAYDKLHERELDAQVTEELSKVKGNLAARIEEPAKRPLYPRGVSRKMMSALCMVLGFGLGLLVGVARAMTDPHIYTVYDLAKASRLPVLGRVPGRDGPSSQGLTEVAGDDLEVPAPVPRESSSGSNTSGAFARLQAPKSPSEPKLLVVEDDEESATVRRAVGSQPEPARAQPPPIPDRARGSDYMVVYSSQRDAGPGDGRRATDKSLVAEGKGQAAVGRSRSAVLASSQGAAFRLAAMGHVLHQGNMPEDPKHHLFLVTAPDGARAEQYRLLRCRLQDLSDPRVVVVTSALPREGKTAAAANLALAYAEGGAHSVVMIDAHLSAPHLTTLFGAQPRAEALVEIEMIAAGLELWQYAPNLFLVPAPGPRGKRSAVLSSPAFAMLIADLRQSFDYVIIDSPAVASAADAKILLRNADAGLFFTRARSTTDKAVRVALDRLGRGVMAGVVLNEFGR